MTLRYSLLLRAVGKWGGANDAKLDVCGGDESARIQRDILAQARRQGLHFGSLRDAARMGSQVCYAARPYNFLIGATGKVMKCTIILDKDDYNVVGRVTPEGNLELDNDRMALWTEPAFEQDSQCRKCVVLPSCQGIHCPLIRIEQNTQPCISTRSNPKGELLAVSMRQVRREGAACQSAAGRPGRPGSRRRANPRKQVDRALTSGGSITMNGAATAQARKELSDG